MIVYAIRVLSTIITNLNVNTGPANIMLQAHILHLNNPTQSHIIGSKDRGKDLNERLFFILGLVTLYMHTMWMLCT